MKYLPFFIISIVMIFSACSSSKPKTTLSAMEIRSIQTKEYDSEDMKLIMNALLSTLQDDGYIIEKAKLKMGLVIAEKVDSVYVSDKKIIRATVNITKNKLINVRVSFNATNFYLSRNNSYLILDKRFYQKFFMKLDKAIFIEKEKI